VNLYFSRKINIAASIAVITVATIVFLFWKNWEKEEFKHAKYIKLNCTHVDSVWNYLIKISDKNLIEFSQDLVNKVEELNRKGLKDSTDKLISYMVDYQEKNPDPGFLVNFYMMQKKLAYLENDIEQYHYWDKKRSGFEPFASVNNKLSNAVITWAYLFERDQYDSCNSILESALALSKAQNDTFYRAAIYINLGASYYEAKLFNRASNCYYEALLSPNLTPIHQQILVPNLMVFLNHEKKYAETLRFYERYKNKIDVAHIQEDLNELISILLCYAHIENNSNKNQYLVHLKAAEQNGILAENEDLYLRTKFAQFKRENHIDSCAALYLKSADVFYESLSYKIESHFDNLSFLMQNGYQVYDLNRLMQEYKTLGDSHIFAAHFYAKLFTNHYRRLNQLDQENYWQKEAAMLDERNQNRLAMLSNSNIQMAIENAKMQLEIRRKRFDINLNNLKNEQLQTASIFIIITAALLILVYFRAKTIQERKWKVLKIQNEISAKSIEIAQKSNEKGRQLVFKSQALFQKLESINENIALSVYNDHPVLVKCKHDILNLLRLKHLENEGEQELGSDIYTQYAYLKTKFRSLTNIGDNAYKIIVHSVLNNDPKDISHLLNLNVQYVRNVRSKVKKEIELETTNFNNWSDLISM